MSAPRSQCSSPAGRVHFVGVGGIHMSALAGLVLDAGGTVSGSDLTLSPLTDALAARGATIRAGHDAGNVCGASLVVRTVAAPDDNPEIVAAARAGIETITRAQMVARLVAGRRVLAVGGSHGKTTVSTMLTLILRAGGRDPGYILGGESLDLPWHAAWGAGPMVLEADEYGRAFHHYAPSVAVITNIDADHLDYYGDAAALAQAFETYALTLQAGGRLVVGAESACAMAVAERVRARRPDIRIETFALGDADGSRRLDTADAGGAQPAQRAGGAGGGVGGGGGGGGRAAGAVGVPGRAAALRAAGRGGRRHGDRRLRASPARDRGDDRGAGRSLRGDGARSCCSSPTPTAARPTCWRAFRTAFRGIDELLIAETYAAREAPEAGIDGAALAAEIREPAAEFVGDLDAAAAAVVARLRDGDVFVAMGAGSVERTGPDVLERLRAR